jgi:hypothetical protein
MFTLLDANASPIVIVVWLWWTTRIGLRGPTRFGRHFQSRGLEIATVVTEGLVSWDVANESKMTYQPNMPNSVPQKIFGSSGIEESIATKHASKRLFVHSMWSSTVHQSRNYGGSRHYPISPHFSNPRIQFLRKKTVYASDFHERRI